MVIAAVIKLQVHSGKSDEILTNLTKHSFAKNGYFKFGL